MTPKKNRSEPTLLQRALDLLGRREYSAQELARRLAAFGHDMDEIASIVTNFEQRGWLSDARFAEQVVNARSRQYGGRRIEQELRDKGVDQATIDTALQMRDVDELELARSLWVKKFGTLPVSQQEKARQVRFLQGRGFPLALIFKVLGSAADDESCDT